MTNTEWIERREPWMTAPGPQLYVRGAAMVWEGCLGTWFWSADRKDPCATTHGPYADGAMAMAACDAGQPRPYSGRGVVR